MAMPPFWAKVEARGRLPLRLRTGCGTDKPHRGGPAKVLLRPVDDAFSQVLQSLVTKVAIIAVFAGVAGDEQGCGGRAPVVRRQPDPQLRMAKPDIDDPAVRGPAPHCDGWHWQV